MSITTVELMGPGFFIFFQTDVVTEEPERPHGWGGAKWQAKYGKRRWKTTEEILKDLRDKREEELKLIEVMPQSQWPLPVDDWMKRVWAVKMILKEREVQKKLRKKKRIVATLLLFDD